MDLGYVKDADALSRDKKKLLGIIWEQKHHENLTFSDIPTSLPPSPMTTTATTTWLDSFHFYRNTWTLVRIVCWILALHMLSSPPTAQHTHTHAHAHTRTHTHTEYLCQQYEWKILDHAPYRFDWAFNSQHFSHYETKQCVKGLRYSDRKVSVHKTIVLEKESTPKKY
jgi:hypothetical protein